jgi:hypothetical protein
MYAISNENQGFTNLTSVGGIAGFAPDPITNILCRPPIEKCGIVMSVLDSNC